MAEILGNVLVIFVIVLHIAFMLLEMFFWTQPLGRRIFATREDFARQSASLAANQGLYNGFLAAGLAWGMIAADTNTLIFFLGCVIVAGIFGAVTAKPVIFWVQAFPAILAMVMMTAMPILS